MGTFEYMLLCLCCIFAHSAFYVLVVVPLVVLYIQHSHACFEYCAGLFPHQSVHVFCPFPGFHSSCFPFSSYWSFYLSLLVVIIDLFWTVSTLVIFFPLVWFIVPSVSEGSI